MTNRQSHSESNQNPNNPANEERIFERPVAWLLGRQLIGGLKGILLYAAYGEKLDPRDWMTGKAFNFADGSNADQEEFWFDYLADAGDGTRAMYSIAYLSMCTLWTTLPSDNTTELPDDEKKRVVMTTVNGGYSLPRGQFLFIGGDTSYHVADYMTLVNRIQRPFRYAYLDLLSHNLISAAEPRRPLFGIPGNHDYYDQVDGFRRQFRKPIRPEGPLPPRRSNPHNAQLTVAGFERAQEASYVALQLPYDWWLWGLDTESGVIDRRQQQFFLECNTAAGKPPGDSGRPKKLIVATCSPSTVFGRIADREDEKTSKSMKRLGLSRPYLPHKNPDGSMNLRATGDEKLKAGECRLDISGDVHHYARYWGPQRKSGPTTRKSTEGESVAANSYASVMSGLGGAFHHPSTTFGGEIKEQVLYPTEDDSRKAVADRLFKFWNVMTGGYVWLAGFILAFAIYFAASVPESSRSFINNIGP